MATEEELTKRGYMEFAARLRDSVLDVSARDLLRAAEESQIHTFGWPIGVVITTEQHKPKPYQDGIRAVIHGDDRYDYWTLKKNGEYYYLGTLFEDTRIENKLFVDTRVVRITEVFLRTAGLYQKLGSGIEEIVDLKIRHNGLSGRILAVASPNRILLDQYKCDEQEIASEFSEPLKNFQEPAKLKELVFKTVKDIVELFDYFPISKQELVDPIVDSFLLGRIA